MRPDFPFSAVVGQDDLKLALLLAAIDPTIGGVLITGERGTAKSTAARGLAALLPATAAGHAAPFVQLPLGATEDRVVGSLDISKVLQDGSSVLRPGVLARADGGVLYVDEVNLLADHIVDLLLDAAASGQVTVERDGISARQAARFVLVGTMNPEEGELRPQFVDRFGLCVHVRGLATQDIRKAAIRQRLSFDDDAGSVLESVAPMEQLLCTGIVAARARLRRLVFTEAHLDRVARLSVEHRLDGIRGDLAMLKAARALAAWQGAAEIGDEHLRRAADFALPHRTRLPKSARTERTPSGGGTTADTRMPDNDQSQAGWQSSVDGPPPSAGHTEPSSADPPLQPAPPDSELPRVRLLTDLVDHEAIGRRGADSLGAQRIIGTRPVQSSSGLAVGSLAITETLSAAAVRGARVSAGGVRLIAPDLRQHEHRGPGRCHVLFLVDASGSMAIQQRLAVAKGAALGLLSSSYQRRDEVALMVFRVDSTDLVLPFTREVTSIERALGEVLSGGRTPLARALLDAKELLQTRQPALLILFTDGRANVSAAGGDPWEEALAAAALLRESCAGALVIDCEAGPIRLSRARLLAQVLGAESLALDDIDDTSLTLRLSGRLEGL